MMGKNSLLAVAIMSATTFVIAFSQLLYKKGSATLEPELSSILLNWPLMLALALYGLVAILVIISLRFGEMSLVMPILSISYVWVMLGAWAFAGEELNFFKIAGTAAVFLGLGLIGLGSKSKKNFQKADDPDIMAAAPCKKTKRDS